MHSVKTSVNTLKSTLLTNTLNSPFDGETVFFEFLFTEMFVITSNLDNSVKISSKNIIQCKNISKMYSENYTARFLSKYIQEPLNYLCCIGIALDISVVYFNQLGA